MPDIIDNNYTGEKIKKLIADNYTSEEKLAQFLNISPQALSKNLSGKATFDIDKLKQIAEFFKISDEELISRKGFDEGLSEFQKAAEGGTAAVKQLIESGANILKADVYGGYLPEYAADKGDKDAFALIADNNGYMIEKGENFKRAAQKIICFAINSYDGYIKILDWYIEREKEFDADLSVFKETEQSGRFDVIEYLLGKKVKTAKKLFNLININKSKKVFDINALALVIAQGRLDKTLDNYINHFQSVKNPIMLFIQYNYDYGFNKFTEILKKKGILSLLIKEDDYINSAVKARNITALKQILAIEPQNCDRYIALCLKNSFEEGYKYIYDKYKKKLNISQAAYYSVRYRQYEFFKSVKGLSQRDYDIALSLTSENDNEMNMYIIKQGGSFNKDFFNQATAQKINNIIKYIVGE